MMQSPPESSDRDDAFIDPSKPLRGVVICCTSIPPEQRATIATRTVEFGGVHKYDLTPEVTHLIVGEYDTPKYRHVARERPDVRPMAVGWIDAVRDLFVGEEWDDEDDDEDPHVGGRLSAAASAQMAELERRYMLRALETGGGVETDGDGGPASRQQQQQQEGGSLTGREDQRGRLLCCLTGFDDTSERQRVISKIHENGGIYTGDLTRKVTHLIVKRPEGRKYAAAKDWGVHTVSIEWLDDSVQRGMILDERCYDPLLPIEDRGSGAWIRQEAMNVSLGKRLRDSVAAAQDQGRRKLRKTASMKLNSQREDLWDNILRSKSRAEEPTQPMDNEASSSEDEADPASTAAAIHKGGPGVGGGHTDTAVFAPCCFHVDGFSRPQTDILLNTISFLGGSIASSLEEVVSWSSGSRQRPTYRLLLVPQQSQPETHPSLPSGIHIVTEFFIEKCLHKKRFFPPDRHVIGRPFPLFPIEGFGDLAISTAGFTGVDLHQVDKAIRQLGARYQERFTSQTSVLVCTNLADVRKQKLDLAVTWKVPVVSAEWLWESISAGFKVPIRQFLFPELGQRLSGEQKQEKRALERTRSEPAPGAAKRWSLLGAGVSASATDASKGESTTTSHFHTAPTHPRQGAANSGPRPPVPLLEKSLSSLNKSPSPPKPRRVPRRPLSKIPSEIADSEGGLGDGDCDEEDDVFDNSRARGVDPDVPRQRTEQQKAAAAERLALSTKLTALLEVTGGTGGTGSLDSLAAVASGEDEVQGASAPRPARRKRGILGRAVSNISAASSASGGATTVEPAGPALLIARKTVGTSFSGAPGLDPEGLLRGSNEAGGGKEEAEGGERGTLPATQIEYEDPEAKRHKARLMSKMMGTAVGGGRHQRQEEEDEEEGRITLMDLEAAQLEEAAVVPGRRSLRRR